MLRYKTASHLRSILKGVSWRILATADTIIVVLLVTCFFDECSIENAIAIGGAEFFLKLIIYYVHERIWLKTLKKQATTAREILNKAISWRIIATGLTFVISGVVLNEFSEIAICVALTELLTKLLLYYFHEKIWLLLPLGKIRDLFLNRKT